MTPRSGQAARIAGGGEDGRASGFVVVLTSAVLAMAGLTLDGGLALAAKVRATGQAESAARAGANAIDLAAYRENGRLVLVPADAAAAAAYLADVGADGEVRITDGTVVVSVTATHTTQLLGLVGIRVLTVHGTGSAHPQRGAQTGGP